MPFRPAPIPCPRRGRSEPSPGPRCPAGWRASVSRLALGARRAPRDILGPFTLSREVVPALHLTGPDLVLHFLGGAWTRPPREAHAHRLKLQFRGPPSLRLGWWQVTAPSSNMAAPILPPPLPDPQFVLRGTQSAVHSLHFCRGAQGQGHPLLLSGSLSGLVHIWSLQTRRALTTLDGHRGQCVTWLQTLPHGHQLLSQGRDLRLCLWDLAEGRNAVVDSVRLESMGFCRSTVLAGAQPRWMLAMPGRGNDEVEILEMPSKTSVCTLKPEADAKLGMPMCLKLWQACGTHEVTNPGIADVTIRPDRKLLATAGWDHRVRIFHWRTMKPLAVLDFHTATVYCVAFADDGLLASGSGDQRISVWSLYQRT